MSISREHTVSQGHGRSKEGGAGVWEQRGFDVWTSCSCDILFVNGDDFRSR